MIAGDRHRAALVLRRCGRRVAAVAAGATAAAGEKQQRAAAANAFEKLSAINRHAYLRE